MFGQELLDDELLYPSLRLFLSRHLSPRLVVHAEVHAWQLVFVRGQVGNEAKRTELGTLEAGVHLGRRSRYGSTLNGCQGGIGIGSLTLPQELMHGIGARELGIAERQGGPDECAQARRTKDLDPGRL